MRPACSDPSGPPIFQRMSDVPGYQRFFAELKRRKVFRVAAVYGAVAFVVLQVADILVPALHLPDSFTTGIAVLSLLGFPIALVLAWAFESTPSGIQKTDLATPGEIEAILAQPPGRRWPSGLLALAGIVMLFVGGWMALSVRDAGTGEASAPGVEVGPSEATAAAEQGSEFPRTAVAVLPFASLTEDAESREFALGIHDDLLTQLTRIGDLRVTSRTSVMTYADSDKPAGEIARELGVGTLVEGGVRSAGGRVRVNVQLIDAATDEHLWAETYDRDLTAENVFAMQAEIARAVTNALEAELSPQEEAALAELPTGSTEAWAAYHRARRLWETTSGDADDRRVVAEYQRAVDLDPGFKEALAGLVRSQSWRLRTGAESDTMPARRSLDRLRAIDPDAPETMLAESYFGYYARADFEGALEPARAYRRLRPGDSDGWQIEGYLLRRLGRWEESTEALRRGAELDPLNAAILWNLAYNHRRFREYDAASRVFREASSLAPANVRLRVNWFQSELLGLGDERSASEISAALRTMSSPDAAAVTEYWLALAKREYEAAAAAIRGVEPGESLRIPASGDQWYELPEPLLLALAARLAGDEVPARTWADSSIALSRAEVAARPVPAGGDRFGVAAVARAVLALGLALRGDPGDADEARDMADAAVRLYGMDRDAADGYSMEQLRLWTLVLLGDHDRALQAVERLLSGPSDLGPGQLELVPIFDPLRADPRFEVLVSRAESLVRG